MLQILFSVFFLSGVGRYKKKNKIKAAASSPSLAEMLFMMRLTKSPPKAVQSLSSREYFVHAGPG